MLRLKPKEDSEKRCCDLRHIKSKNLKLNQNRVQSPQRLDTFPPSNNIVTQQFKVMQSIDRCLSHIYFSLYYKLFISLQCEMSIIHKYCGHFARKNVLVSHMYSCVSHIPRKTEKKMGPTGYYFPVTHPNVLIVILPSSCDPST